MRDRSQCLEGQAPARNGEGNMAKNVVLDLMVGLEGKGHVVVCDNYFLSIGLFMELYSCNIYCTGTMHSNRVGLSSNLSNLRAWNQVEQGTLEWKMHNSNKIACVMWEDKRVVLLISTHAIPFQVPCIHPKFFTTVLYKNGPVQDLVNSSPILWSTPQRWGMWTLPINCKHPTHVKLEPISGGIGFFSISLTQLLWTCT